MCSELRGLVAWLEGRGVLIDAHVHLFPDRLFEAIWAWFDRNAWVIRDKLYADAALDTLEEAGCDRVVGLLYAHRVGMAESLNAWMGELARRRPVVVPCATVHPFDEDVRAVLARAQEIHGARIVKQHCHVLGIGPDDPRMFPIYEACVELGLPLNLHAGNGPKLRGYSAPTDFVSGADRTQVVLDRYPELLLVVPHLGSMDEEQFVAWLDRYPNLYLDTAMALVPFDSSLAFTRRRELVDHPGRVLFGTDYPNIPYPLRSERDVAASLGLSPSSLRELMGDAAARLLGLAETR